MTDKVFIDASAFVALYNDDDSCHNQAKNILQSLSKKDVILTTSYEAVLETATVLRRKSGLPAAADFLDQIRTGAFFLLVVDESIRSRAEEIFLTHKRPKDLGLFDCLYFSLMENYGIPEAFSFDHHFKKLGVKLLSA